MSGMFFFETHCMCSHRHVILDQPAKFGSNRTIGGGVIMSYRFFRWRP